MAGKNIIFTLPHTLPSFKILGLIHRESFGEKPANFLVTLLYLIPVILLAFIFKYAENPILNGQKRFISMNFVVSHRKYICQSTSRRIAQKRTFLFYYDYWFGNRCSAIYSKIKSKRNYNIQIRKLDGRGILKLND